MVTHAIKIERSVERHIEAGWVNDCPSLGEFIGIIWRRRCAKDKGVEAVHSMHMKIAEVGVAVGIGSIGSG